MYTVTKYLSRFHSVRRFYSDDTTRLKKSIFLPVTKFKNRLNADQTIQRDSHIFKTCGFSELYSWQRQHVNNEEYILHDGPPYANGSAHMGHAINKILKDITIRSKLVNGKKISYIPGWDCHGLPIELKAEKIHGNRWKNFGPLEIRKSARKYASKEIEKQKTVFKSWGILADWENNCYYTYDKKYVQNQIQQFFKLYKKGLIYRDLKPVYWSPSSKSALAEAELEYNPNHQSKSVTVKLELCSSTLSIDLTNHNSEPIYALIWTTTPWTLPGNIAVVYSPNLLYSFVKIQDTLGVYLLATELVENLSAKIGKPIEIITTIKSQHLSGLKYKSLRNGESDKQFLEGDHVTIDKGTGLVHTAPAYGHEDFLIALKHKVPIECHVDEHGIFMPQTWSELVGLPVLDIGNETVCSLLSDKILHTEIYEHSYPYDWRTKLPVIVRASKQWFLDTAAIKSQSIECLKDIKIYPELGGSRNALLTLIEKRPYWCISRQRSWGVPIPVLYDESDSTIIDEKLLDQYYSLLEKTGEDFWWIHDVQKLVTNTPHSPEKLKKGLDILDIWFDSGISWSCVLGDNKIADLYLEGVDQCTGWFQASLMSSIALRNISPFKSLFVHGFVVDKNGRKMSKSIGNVIDPQDIVNGNYDKSINGIDVLRWWVAKHGSHQTNIPVTKETMNDSKQSVDKLRLIIRFLLGSLNNVKENNFMHGTNHLRYLDKYMMLELISFENETNKLYNTFQYNKVCAKLLHFITNQVSGLYVHHIKDRLYCDPMESDDRLACTATLQAILETLLKHIAPILPHLAEEAFSYYPLKRNTTFFKSSIMNLNQIVIPDSEQVTSIMENALMVKNKVSNLLQGKNSLEQSLVIALPDKTFNLLKILHPKNNTRKSDLIELLQVNSIELILNDTIDIKTSDTKGILCKRCRRWSAEKKDDLCKRCEETVNIFYSK
ncbi:isoleucine--tRNA ligase, mitochondrial [Metopolophium dirhodum]|uniref:isoleucine--tRNA ligase, mitochondrial n=1 Tax=Metopolophium dirhodum TaxID=44670 RepID=UPI00299000DB|nr:isoleucine--tRNA ligase, mitochondrial [Metopolophium dirhodum]XP_060879353.1 isoleucine--tRNA ligase, mitochondrial [Metopolophium dirhodum]